jgi:hypothetical protein
MAEMNESSESAGAMQEQEHVFGLRHILKKLRELINDFVEVC